MDKKTIEELKQSLEQKKTELEKELGRFAEKDKKLKGDWDTRFPSFDSGETGSTALEEAADEVTEYSTLLPIEHNLELRLRDINLALEKIKKGNYGQCENCRKEIPLERLEVSPEARLCISYEAKK